MKEPCMTYTRKSHPKSHPFMKVTVYLFRSLLYLSTSPALLSFPPLSLYLYLSKSHPFMKVTVPTNTRCSVGMPIDDKY